MAANVKTVSVTVDFSANQDSSGILSAEVDSREDGLNDGNTSFIPGVDDPVILLFKSAGVVIDEMTTSIGTLTPTTSGEPYEVDEFVQFNNTRSSSLSYPNSQPSNPSSPGSGSFTYEWYGVNGGVVTDTETQINIPLKAVAALRMKYVSAYTAYRLTNVPAEINGETEFPVIIYIAGHEE